MESLIHPIFRNGTDKELISLTTEWPKTMTIDEIIKDIQNPSHDWVKKEKEVSHPGQTPSKYTNTTTESQYIDTREQDLGPEV